MVNYQEGKIYKIVSNTDDDICYVGSTTKKYLSQRMDSHRSDYKKLKKGKNINTSAYKMFEKFGVENCRIELIEVYPSNSKDELIKKEGEHIRKLNCVNRCIMGRTKREYYDDNINKILTYNKILRQKNKDVISKKQKVYYQKNKDNLLEKDKIRYEKNKDIILEKKKIYYEENRDIISEKRKQKYTCCCGSNICITEKSRHEKTKKHIGYIQSQST